MSDLRGISRGSKTAAVVILEVLLQVIVVAVLGLGTIAREREAAARTAKDNAERRAEEQAQEIVDKTRDGVIGQLRVAARAAREPGGLRSQELQPWHKAFLDVFRVDADG